jgi:hypothetical protein
MLGCILLSTCVGCVYFGKASLTRYQGSPSPELSWLGCSVVGFLGAALNLAAAAVSFTR